MGLALDDIEFALVLAREGADPQRSTPARSWTTLQAQAATATVVGLPDGLVLRASSIEVAVNQAGGTATTVIDYGTGATDLSVATGSGGASLDLDLAGALGETLRASAAFEVDLFGFVQFNGQLAVEKSTRQLTLAARSGQPAQQISTEVLTIKVRKLNLHFLNFVLYNATRERQLLPHRSFSLNLERPTKEAHAGQGQTERY